MRKTITHALLALSLAVAVGATSVGSVDAHGRGNVAAGVAVGTLLGLGIAGAYAGPRYYGYGPAYHGPGCYPGPRQCGWAGRRCWRDAYGEPICRGGEWRCWRPAICD